MAEGPDASAVEPKNQGVTSSRTGGQMQRTEIFRALTVVRLIASLSMRAKKCGSKGHGRKSLFWLRQKSRCSATARFWLCAKRSVVAWAFV